MVAVAWMLAGAEPALAHAQLRATEPVAGASLAEGPSAVTVRFSQAVEASLGALRVYDSAARRVDDGQARHAQGDRSAVTVDVPALDRGTYVVTWRVVSSDAHSVRGAVTFHVGPVPPGDADALTRRLLAAQGGSALVGALWAAARALGFGALLVLVGGGAFMATSWAGGRVDRQVRRLLVGAAAALAVATAAGIGLQAAAGAGLPAADLLRAGVWSAAVETRFGRLSVARLAAVAALAWAGGRWLRASLSPAPTPTVEAATRAARPRILAAAAAAAAVALLATFALAGHAATGPWSGLAVVVDVVHLAAAAVWIGGLAVLAGVVLRGGVEVPVVVVAARRFSTVAFGAVAVVALTGAVQAWRQVSTPAALTSTTYGRLLVVKVGLVAVVVVLGWRSRQAARRSPVPTVPVLAGARAHAPTDARPATLSELRRSVGREALVAAAVVVAAALLVNLTPARIDHARPYSTEVEAGRILVSVTLDPARAGSTDLHLYTFDQAGSVLDVSLVTAEARLPSQDIGPLAVPVRRAGPGHFAAYGFVLPVPGAWEIDLDIIPRGDSPVADPAESATVEVVVR